MPTANQLSANPLPADLLTADEYAAYQQEYAAYLRTSEQDVRADERTYAEAMCQAEKDWLLSKGYDPFGGQTVDEFLDDLVGGEPCGQMFADDVEG